MSTVYMVGDALDMLNTLPDSSVNCVVTSPPYYNLRDYGIAGQIGLEDSLSDYISKLVSVFRGVGRVLTDDGTVWINIADSYAGGAGRWGGDKGLTAKQKANRGIVLKRNGIPDGMKPTDLMGIPWELAFALRRDGWYLRSDVIWSKTNGMPESVTTRPCKGHEYVFLLTKSPSYYYDYEAVAERDKKGKPKRKRDVWVIPTQKFKGSHFATMPEKLVEPCILAGCPVGGLVLDPFGGAGTVAKVARDLGRNSIYIDLNPDYAEIARKRLGD